MKKEQGSVVGGVLLTIVGIILIAAILWGGYLFGWWLKKDQTERRVRIDNEQLGTQTAWHDRALKAVTDYELLDESNTASRGLLRQQACELIGRLSDSYRDDTFVAFQQEQC